MKLWQAMLEGAKLGPQVFGHANSDKGDGGTCAIGAVCKAVGVSNAEMVWNNGLNNLYPELLSASNCPQCENKGFEYWGFWYEFNLQRVIVHLNNDHRWSRQRIAEWLANRELKFIESKTKEIAVKSQEALI
jgi:hypothetical protein